MQDTNKTNVNLNTQPTDTNFKPSTPNQIPTNFLFRFSKKKLLIIILIILVLPTIYIVSNFLLHKTKTKQEDKSLTIGNTKKLSPEEWNTILSSAKKELSINNLSQVLSPSKLENPLTQKSVSGVYSKVGNNFNLDPSVHIGSVKGDSTENTISVEPKINDFKQNKLHFSLKLEGSSKNDNGDKEDVNFLVSYLGLQNLESDQAQSDLIINGKWGKLVLEDDGINPLHISTINLDKNKIAVNIETSDYVLVFLDRILNREKQREEGNISVDTYQIYPYFGNYVNINNENSSLNNNMINLIAVANSFKETAFIETIGSIDKYVKEGTNSELTSSSDLGLVMVEIDQQKFKDTLKDYLSKIEQYYSSNSDKYKQLCQNQTECLNKLGYMSEENINNTEIILEYVFNQYSIDKSGLIIDPKDLSFKGFALDISKKDGVDITNQLLDIQKISFSFYLKKLENPNKLFTPDKIITTDALPTDSQYGKSEQGNTLYTENKSFMRSFKTDLWQAIISVKSDQFCNIWWKPGFCFQDTNKWLIFNPDPKTYDRISMYYNLGSKETSEPELSIKIEPTNYDIISECYYDKTKDGEALAYSEYKDIVTNQGLRLRISSYNNKDGFTGDICMLNGESYTTKLPFSGRIEIYGKNTTFDKSVDYFSDVLKTIKIDDDVNLNQYQSAPSNPDIYPEKEQSIKSDGLFVSINNADSKKGNECYLSSDYYYVMDSYGIARDSKNIVFFPLKQAVCIGENTCILCGKDGFDEVDISNCKGLRCNR